MRCCRPLHLPQQRRRTDGNDDLSEPSAPSDLPACRVDCDSHFVLSLCLPSLLQFYYPGSMGWICYHKTSSATTMALGDWQNQITRVRKHRLFMEASHFNNCQIFWWHISWMNVSFVSFVSVFVSWQCLYLSDPNMSSRYASIFIKGRLRYFLPAWRDAALYAILQNHNRVSLSTPSWRLFLFYSFNYEEWNMGLDIFCALFLCVRSILFRTISRFVEFSSHKLINQVENAGVTASQD